MSTPKRILYWFRNDLRLHDNEGFARAVEQADVVLPVYCFNPSEFKELSTLGVRKTGIFRTQFLIETIADLRRSLQQRGANLIIRIGEPDKVLAELAEDIQAEAIYASKEVTQEETELESRLSKRLKILNIDLELFWMTTLYHVRDLPFPISKLPDVFTKFRLGIEASTTVRPTFPTPHKVTCVSDVSPGDLPALAHFGFSDKPMSDSRAAIIFKGGESEGLRRLRQYLWERDRLRTYKETRNEMMGEDYSSKFSAWLSLGCLSPRHIYEEVKRYEAERVKEDNSALKSTYWLIFELLWRDFFRFIALKYGTRLFKLSGIRHDIKKQWHRDVKLFRKWTDGQTGIPFVDANMRELNATGFMSNRGRQNTASFLVNDLGIDWTWGAAYFESLLIDYDVTSNWGNWNYVAGLGTVSPTAEPRPDRHFNIHQQAVHYDEQGNYTKHWLPELVTIPADRLHNIWNLTQQEQTEYGVTLGRDYPSPVIQLNKGLKESGFH